MPQREEKSQQEIHLIKWGYIQPIAHSHILHSASYFYIYIYIQMQMKMTASRKKGSEQFTSSDMFYYWSNYT